MTIKYELRLEDHLALARFHYDTSPSVRRSLIKAQVVAALLLPMLIALGYVLDSAPSMLLLVAVGIGYFLFVRFYHRRSYLKSAEKMLRGTKDHPLVEIVSLASSDPGLTITTEAGEYTGAWSSFDRIEITDSHAVVFVDGHKALIIPRQSVLNGEFETFAADLRTRLGR